LRPLTNRILDRLPGPWALWVTVWALVPWANAGANVLLGRSGTSAVWEQNHVLVVLNYAALSFAVAVTLWGTDRIRRRLEALQGVDGLRKGFRELDGVVGPLVASVATAIVFGAAALVRDGWASGLIRGATWLVLGVAFWTFLWTYAWLQVGLVRLGRERVIPEAARVDPGLGLQPFGRLAFTGLWLLLIWLVPVVLTGLPDVVGIAIGIGVLGGALAAFLLSLYRLHRQMVEVKSRELALARRLYGEAYEPVHASRTLEALEQQRGLLSAADALERRAGAIHEWPVDEGIVVRIVTIATSVIAAIIGRLILEPVGL
jgi:hypothetical protein